MAVALDAYCKDAIIPVGSSLVVVGGDQKIVITYGVLKFTGHKRRL